MKKLALYLLGILHVINKLASMRNADERRRKVESYEIMKARIEKGSFAWTLAIVVPFFFIGLVIIVFILFLLFAK
jgi:hypothetical protein